MVWVFSDGTEVRLGGDVRGQSALAERLRQDVVAITEEGAPIPVVVRPPPGSEPLDLDSAPHVDAWVRQWARLRDADIVSAPVVDRLGDDSAADDSEPGRVY
ncbi:MAG TPA: hypothetical protein VLJ42_10410 [Solirubrobacteraceae bacterium]|nr:hypothetical protein [Solirubrobacteraceae bacterium]